MAPFAGQRALLIQCDNGIRRQHCSNGHADTLKMEIDGVCRQYSVASIGGAREDDPLEIFVHKCGEPATDLAAMTVWLQELCWHVPVRTCFPILKPRYG